MLKTNNAELKNQPMYIESVTSYALYEFVYIDENGQLRSEISMSPNYPVERMIRQTVYESKIEIEGISRERLPDKFKDVLICHDIEIKATFYFESLYTRGDYFHNKYIGYVEL